MQKADTVKKRRFLTKDYDFIANYIDEELDRRKGLKYRKRHEALWAEVDRQVSMEPMEVMRNDPDMDWRSALEMGDMATASEVICADALRLIFPQDRKWLAVHSDIDWKRLANREPNLSIPEAEQRKVQKKADSELRAMMTQQHKDFGFRSRVGLSIKEALHHGSFVVEGVWEALQEYKQDGVFRSCEAPVWLPHSMWNCYPETLELNANIIYGGSMIICEEKSFEWVMTRDHFINKKKFEDATTNKKDKVELKKYIGNITVKRKGDDVFLPNMKIIMANKVVLFAEPNKCGTIIYGGYDRVDVRDPYYMSPLVKQSTNHRIVTTIANKFIDNIELKLEPPIVYDGNDPTLVAMGGPKIIPGEQIPTKSGAQNFKQIDIGDPSWAGEAIMKFQQDIKEGTGVSTSRAGGSRQADRVTATQIEEESAGANVRTVDFVGKIEKAIESFCYMQHEINKINLNEYKFYNPDMGMPDFDSLKKGDLPNSVIFECVGSKGVLTERRRAEQTSMAMTFLLGNPLTANLVNREEMARQMLLDAGNKNPEMLLNLSDEDQKMDERVMELQQQLQQVQQEMGGQIQQLTQKLTEKEMRLSVKEDQMQSRNERAEANESYLRNEVRALKAQMARSAKFIEELGKITDEAQRVERIKKEIEHNNEIQRVESKSSEKETKQSDESSESKQPPVTVIVQKSGGYNIERDPKTGDMSGIMPKELN